jgi:predicted peroxiredoxin
MSADNKVVVGLTHGENDPEDVLIGFLAAVEAVRAGKDTLIFLTKDAVTLAFDGGAESIEVPGAPSVPELFTEYVDHGGHIYACPVCVKLRGLTDEPLAGKAEIKGFPAMYEFAEGGALVFNY